MSRDRLLSSYLAEEVDGRWNGEGDNDDDDDGDAPAIKAFVLCDG